MTTLEFGDFQKLCVSKGINLIDVRSPLSNYVDMTFEVDESIKSFALNLTRHGISKMDCIKIIRKTNDMGLLEAKILCEAGGTIKVFYKRSDAEEVLNRLVEIGCVASID